MSAIENIHRLLRAKKKTLAFAESCTGGALAAAVIALPGASDFFLGSLVVYSDALKQQLLHVSPETLRHKGAVSREAVSEMLQGLVAATGADYALAVSGVAGPSGGSEQAPVGTVWVAIGGTNKPAHLFTFCLEGLERNLFMKTTCHRLFDALWEEITKHVKN